MPDDAPNMQERMEHMGHAAGDMASQAQDAAKQAKDKVADVSQQSLQYAREKSRMVQDMTEHYVQENPWYAVGIAVGVGVLVGLLISNSRS